MATQDVIREFLVSLSYKVDQAALARFKGGIEDATKSASKLATIVTGAALSVGVAVKRFADNMESLYFASQRTGASVKGIKAVQHAARQLGATSEEAMGSIESLSRFMRNNPAGESWIKGMLGVDTRDAAGNMRDVADVMVDIGQALGRMPTAQANQLAGVLGIDDRMMLAIRSGDFAKFAADYKDLAANTDFEGAARKAHAMNERFRELQEQISAGLSEVGSKLLDVFGPDMAKAAKWAKDHSTEIAGVFYAMGETIKTVFSWIGKAVSMSVEGWKNLFSWLPAAYNMLPAAMRKWLENKLGVSSGAPASPVPPAAPAAPSSDAAAGNLPRGLRNNNPGNLNYAGQAGATREGGPGGRFAVFGNAQAGLNALANQLDIYRQRGINTVQGIIGKWAPPSENNTGAYINRVAQSLGVGAGDKINLGDPAVMSRIMSAIIQHENGRNPYSQDMILTAARNTRGAAISQNTTINVTGSGAAETGRAVAGEQDRVNQRLARYAGAGAL